jgi:hypothetical protein
MFPLRWAPAKEVASKTLGTRRNRRRFMPRTVYRCDGFFKDIDTAPDA